MSNKALKWVSFACYIDLFGSLEHLKYSAIFVIIIDLPQKDCDNKYFLLVKALFLPGYHEK
jgi:hypothetical protein